MTTATTGSADNSGYPTPAVSVARMFYDRVAATPGRSRFASRPGPAGHR